MLPSLSNQVIASPTGVLEMPLMVMTAKGSD